MNGWDKYVIKDSANVIDIERPTGEVLIIWFTSLQTKLFVMILLDSPKKSNYVNMILSVGVGNLGYISPPEIAYRQISNKRRTLEGTSFVDHSDVVGASPVGAAPTTSSFST